MKISFEGHHFILSTKDKELLRKFRYSKKIKTWSNVYNKWIERTEYVNLYEKINKFTYKFSEGWIFYVLNMIADKITPEEKKEIINRFKADFGELNYYGLYDYQREDLDKLLKYSMGIFQCYTGYGKSECISVAVKNFIDKGLNVLVIAPSKAAATEIRDRIRRYYSGTIKSTMSGSTQVNIISPKSLVKSSQWESLRSRDFEPFSKVDVVLADEVEMTLNKSFYRIKKRLTNCKYFYGFSASANKASTDPIPRDSKLRKMLDDQISQLVANYGYTAVYKLPSKNNLTITNLNTNLSGYRFVGKSKSSSAYAKLVTNLYHYRKFKDAIKYILDRVDNLYIPINNLDAIKDLIKSNLTSRQIMSIQGSGIHIYQDGHHTKDVCLSKAKEMVKNGEIHLVLGTISSFRALDFRGLNNILCTFGKSCSVIIQYVGRISRETNMNLWYIESSPRINIYSKTIENNRHMIEDFYADCDIQYKEEFLT